MATIGVIVATMTILAGCGPQPAPTVTPDPNEVANRADPCLQQGRRHRGGAPGQPGLRHDRAGAAAAGREQRGRNLEAPGDIINGILQGRPENAAQNSLRFAVNLTMGLGGIFDAATAIGLPRPQTDFGETLHVWGAPEGNYIELPFFGPSTERDTVGRLVDMAMNPRGC